MPKDTLTGRDNAGRFLPGQSGNPNGRPVGSVNRALQQLRAWTLEKGLPLLMEQAEAGDQDALRLLVSLGLPKSKPQAAPIDGIQDLPRPRSAADLDKVQAAIYEFVARGTLSLEDADALMKLAERLVEGIRKAQWQKRAALHEETEDPFALFQNSDFPALEPGDTVKVTAKRSFK